MKADVANAFLMPSGEYKGIKLCNVPSRCLKSGIKHWIKKDLKDAARMILESRSIGGHEELKKEDVIYNSNPESVFKGMEYRDKPPLDFAKGAFGKLKEELENAPSGLF